MGCAAGGSYATTHSDDASKEIAVFKILSVFPTRMILYLCGINMLITLIVTLCICPLFFAVALLESIIYLMIFYSYQAKKTVSILKGE